MDNIRDQSVYSSIISTAPVARRRLMRSRPADLDTLCARIRGRLDGLYSHPDYPSMEHIRAEMAEVSRDLDRMQALFPPSGAESAKMCRAYIDRGIERICTLKKMHNFRLFLSDLGLDITHDFRGYALRTGDEE